MKTPSSLIPAFPFYKYINIILDYRVILASPRFFIKARVRMNFLVKYHFLALNSRSFFRIEVIRNL